MIKRLLVLVLGVILGVGQAMAQSSPTVHNIGFIGGRNTTGENEKKVTYIYSGGAVGATGEYKDILSGQIDLVTGFPYPVSYFPVVFDQDLFVSKGYFSEYVQLQWNAIAMADRIKKFKIFRKPLGVEGDSLLVAVVAADQFTWRDQYAEKGILYKYTLFAEGLADALRMPYVNFIESTGFSTATGTVAGRITYEGGTAVEGVAIVAETEEALSGKSLYFNGHDGYALIPHQANDAELEISGGFSLQMWVKHEGNAKGVLFSKGSQYELSYDGAVLDFTVNGTSLQMPYVQPADSFFHITAAYNPADSLRLFAYTIDDAGKRASAASGAKPNASDDNIYIGKSAATANHFKGYIDEVRLWNKTLTNAEVLRDYGRYLVGNESGLVGYWRLQAGVGKQFYDMSRRGFKFYENHGYLFNTSWSSLIPPKAQLGYKGFTDAKGNFTITGFPYKSEGTLYTFTPMLGVHSFEPTQRLKFVGDGQSIHNDLDFKDVSSFKVTGTVRYKGTKFPVEGVSFYIDGKAAINSEGQLILSDRLGQFRVDVPIGPHTLQARMNMHGFEGDGRFPGIDAEGEPIKFDYQKPLSGIEFIDTTLVKLAGRVVGGPVQGAIPLGFGRSKDNIGDATIILRSEKGYSLIENSNVPVAKTFREQHFKTDATFTAQDIVLRPDAKSGEYVAMLPPEKFKIVSIEAGSYIFDENHHTTVDLRNTAKEKEVLEEVVGALVNGDTLLSFPPVIKNRYKAIVHNRVSDTTYLIGVDSFYFDHKKSFVYRVSPAIEVANATGAPYFGDEEFVYTDKNIGVTDTIPLYTANGYTFAHPAFTQRKPYRFLINLFEEYTNADDNTTDRVPVIDGKLEIVNNLAINTQKEVIGVNERGRALYTFAGGLPQITTDPVNPENSFTKTISITALSGNDGAIKTIWRESNPFRGYLFGAMPVGNNFVTNGPTQMTTIIRDPQGSNSYAYLSEGETISSTEYWSDSEFLAEDAMLTNKFGLSMKTWAGVGGGVISESESKFNIETGLSSQQSWTAEGSSVVTTEVSKTISTSAEPDYVGSGGDLFVGYSTNIVYGKALDLMPVPVTDCGDDCGEQEYDGYKLGLKTTLRLNPEFDTYFIYSQTYIKDVLIPNLRNVRNSFLQFTENHASVSAADKPVYISLVAPTEENFGSNNDDKKVWGALASTAKIKGAGPSYIIKVPALWEAEKRDVTDSVQYFNRQIDGWEYWLGENERRKIEAVKEENISFDAGATFEKSVTVDTTTSSSRTFYWTISGSLGLTTGWEWNKFGQDLAVTISSGGDWTKTSTQDVSKTTTYGYVLQDGDAGDYYSIDVKKPKDGFGPVFSVRGGAAMCPYLGEEVTEYYNAGTLLNPPLVAREKPGISTNKAVVADVPENRAAEFVLYLYNYSESEEDAVYSLEVDDTTNPFGAIIEIDGLPIGNGRIFKVPYGKTLQKSLKIRKGRSDIMDYEDINLIFSSQCDDGVSSSTSVSVFYQPGCSDIAMSAPKDKWVLNTNTRPEETLAVTLEKYDLNFGNFRKILFQYKPSGSSQWTTDMVFYNPNAVTEAEFAAADEPKAWIKGPKINYMWNMSSLPDRNYDIRAKTICELAPGVEVETPTEILSGIKDVKRPKVFGTPQPADGILSANDEILLQFDEEIEAGLLTPFNFSVTGVLNNYKIRHDASIGFAGANSSVRIPDGLDLNNRSYTIEFWAQRNRTYKEEIIFSKGYNAQEVLEIGFDAANHLVVNVSGSKLTSSGVVENTEWNHIAVVFNKEDNTISAFINDQTFFNKAAVAGTYQGFGEIRLGKSVFSNDAPFTGNLHELRIWAKALQLGTVYAQMNQALSGNEIGLTGYWPMDEAYGNKALDKARFRHAIVHADWVVLPKGKAYAFDGVDDYLEISTGGTVVITNEMDFTIEFWFNAVAGQTNTVMFSSGRGDGTDKYNVGNWSIGLNNSGHIYVAANGQQTSLSGSGNLFADNTWHHLALTVSRTGNMNLFIDGAQRSSTPVSGAPALTGTRMWIGARGYREENGSVTPDHFFKGMLDDVRIWKLARRQNQINLDRMAKLKGDEMGLVAYYPFEQFQTINGIKISSPGLADQWQNPYGANAGTAVAKGGGNYSDNSPNIKEARPVQKVDFDWTVNKDKIVITPSASMAPVIEKVILEFTIDGVQDLYENSLASPVTWTAFIDRNQVKWGEPSLALEKELYKPLSFTMDVINLGGSEENFSIRNLPAWLTADAKEGVIAPLSARKITFTINPGINTGYYSEDVFLRTSFGFDEKLQLDLRVFEKEPEWTITPSDYQYSMNVIGRLEINGVISTDRYDKVSAFVGGECRGVANVQYVEEFDQYLVFLDLYSNTLTGEKLEFRVWNASEATEHRSVKPAVTFASNKLLGTPLMPLAIQANDVFVQKTRYAKGWSWVSYNVNSPELANINELFSSVKAQNKDQIKGQAVVDVYTEGFGWTGTLSQKGGLKSGNMYMLKLGNGGNVEVVGTPADPEQQIQMQEGWNWIGFNPRFNMEVNEAFAFFNPVNGDIVKSQFAFAYYDNRKGWIGSLRYMMPGNGYMYMSQKAGKLKYPKTSMLSQGRVTGGDKEVDDLDGLARKYPFTMSVIATVEGLSPAPGHALKGQVNGEMAGRVSPLNMEDGAPLYFLTLHGEGAGSTVTFRLQDEAGTLYEVNESLSFVPDQVHGTPYQPLLLTLGGKVEDLKLTPVSGIEVYPNPYTESTTVRIREKQLVAPKVQVMDILGRPVAELKVSEEGGGFVAKWSGRNGSGAIVPAGTYLIHILTESGSKTVKVVKAAN